VVRDADLTKNLLTRLERVDSKKIIGLLMGPETLAEIREERSSYTNGAGKGLLKDYYDIGQVTMEFRFCRDLFHARDWPVVNVTHRAIEEVSKEILKLLGLPYPRMA
jgi:regulator of PEP synthase PpsR (kinase-PPPase family)